jgi:hypothetical protein
MPATAQAASMTAAGQRAEGRLAATAHSVDEQECRTAGCLLLRSCSAGGNRPRSAEEEVGIFEFEASRPRNGDLTGSSTARGTR